MLFTQLQIHFVLPEIMEPLHMYVCVSYSQKNLRTKIFKVEQILLLKNFMI